MKNNIKNTLLLSAAIITIGTVSHSSLVFAQADEGDDWMQQQQFWNNLNGSNNIGTNALGQNGIIYTCYDYAGNLTDNAHCDEAEANNGLTKPIINCTAGTTPTTGPFGTPLTPTTISITPTVYGGGGGDGGGGGGGHSGYDTNGDGRPDSTSHTSGGDYISNADSFDNSNPSGGGGGGGGGGGCFVAGTLVEMADGSQKKIEEIQLGDIVKDGGRVLAAGSLFSYDIYNYKGVQVSGSHAVLEDGIWIRVRDSKLATLISEEETVVYVHSNENCRILIAGTTFADLTEFSATDTDVHNIYHDALLKLLNDREPQKQQIMAA